jgi:hypothetical protein
MNIITSTFQKMMGWMSMESIGFVSIGFGWDQIGWELGQNWAEFQQNRNTIGHFDV